MTAIFELHLPSETLAADELSEITGAKTHDGQRTWLEANRWKHHANRAGRPIVGLMYARLKLAGIEASLETALSVLEQIATAPRNRGAKRSAAATLAFLRAQLGAMAENG